MKRTVLFTILAVAIVGLSCGKKGDGNSALGAVFGSGSQGGVLGAVFGPTSQGDAYLSKNATRIASTADAGFVVTTASEGKVQIFNSAGLPTGEFKARGVPVSVAVRSNGEILIGDTRLQRIDVYAADGTFSRTLCTGIRFPGDLALNEGAEVVYVTDGKANDVKSCPLNAGSTVQATFFAQTAPESESPGATANLRFPTGIAYDALNNRVLVADFMNRRIVIYDTSGNYQSLIEKTSVTPLVRPQGISVDQFGTIYVADVIQHALFVFNSEGVFQEMVGQHGEQSGELRVPLDVQVQPDGRILVTNSLNNRIEVF